MYVCIYLLYPTQRRQLFERRNSKYLRYFISLSVPEVKILLLSCFVIVFGITALVNLSIGIRDASIISDRLFAYLPAKPEEAMAIIHAIKNMMSWRCCWSLSLMLPHIFWWGCFLGQICCLRFKWHMLKRECKKLCVTLLLVLGGIPTHCPLVLLVSS